ncbi:GNAT family N-acetyltransferase [Candidatus Latescibacterota bacterium]
MVIDDIVVDDSHRRKGIGRKIVEHCIELATKREVDSVELRLLAVGLHRLAQLRKRPPNPLPPA